MKTVRDLLADERFFADIGEEALDLLAGCGRLVRFVEGAIVFREGDAADRFWLVRQGRVALEIHAPGRGPLVVATVGPGQMLGWSWLHPPYRWQFDARVVDDTSAISFDATCLRAKCTSDPAFGYDLMRRFSSVIADRLQAARLQLLDLYGDPAPGRSNDSPSIEPAHPGGDARGEVDDG